MTTEPQAFVLIHTDAIEALTREVIALRESIAGATIIPAPEWLSISEAARVMGVTSITVKRRIAKGILEAKGAGRLRRVKIDPSDRTSWR